MQCHFTYCKFDHESSILERESSYHCRVKGRPLRENKREDSSTARFDSDHSVLLH